MDIQRMIALNRYTRNDISALTGVDIKDQSVIYVGNVLQYHTLNKHILDYKPISIYGDGKLTAVLSVCDENNFEYEICNEIGYDPDTVYIIRNPEKGLTLNTGIRIVLLYDDHRSLSLVRSKIILNKVDKDEYFEKKGYPLIETHESKETYDRVQIMKHLKKGNIYPLPHNTHRWIITTFSNNPKIVKICYLAEKYANNKDVYYGLMKMIKCRRSINLRFPIWVKRKKK